MKTHRTEHPGAPLSRRALLATAGGLLVLPGVSWAVGADEAATLALLQTGGLVVAFRHATAPGSFDPPQFKLGDCSTQRNLSDEGRSQARRTGQWFAQRGLRPAQVRSSPWCRCVDTATLAFEAPQVWPALGSPHGSPETTGAAHLRELRAALGRASQQAGQFEVWVTHMFVLQDLADTRTSSGEGLLLRTNAKGAVQVLARLQIA